MQSRPAALCTQEGLLRCARWEHSSTHTRHTAKIAGPQSAHNLVRSGALFGARLLAPLVAAGLAAGDTLNADTMTQSWNASHPVP